MLLITLERLRMQKSLGTVSSSRSKYKTNRNFGRRIAGLVAGRFERWWMKDFFDTFAWFKALRNWIVLSVKFGMQTSSRTTGESVLTSSEILVNLVEQEGNSTMRHAKQRNWLRTWSLATKGRFLKILFQIAADRIPMTWEFSQSSPGVYHKFETSCTSFRTYSE